MWTTLAVLTAGASMGCAHDPAGGVSAELVESAYLQARMPSARCPQSEPDCCANRLQAARSAAAAGHTAAAASRWQEVALACPQLRAEAAAGARSAMRAPGTAATGTSDPGAGARVLNVAYRTRLSPAMRLYWVSAAAGARLMPTAGAEPAVTHPVHVQVQAIRFDNGRPGPLLQVERRFDVPFEREAVITLEIAEVPGSGGAAPALEILPQVEAVPIARPRSSSAPAPRRPPPTLEKARPRKLDPPRSPLEFGAGLVGARPSVRLCLDQEGRFQTLRFLEPTHPRLAASILDMFRDAHHDPYRVDDRPVPSCEVTRPTWPPPAP